MGKSSALAALAVIFGLVGSYLLHFPFRMLEDWVMGEIERRLAENWQIYLSFFITWVLPFLIVFGAMGLVYRLKSRDQWKIAKVSIQGEKRVNEEEKQQPQIHVESHNQQGGITAYQVNIQPGDRQLSSSAAEQLKNYLNGVKFKAIEVNAVMGDGEAFRFASQIKNFLTSEGFAVKGVNQVVYTAPVQGQRIEPPNNEGLVKIIIGNR